MTNVLFVCLGNICRSPMAEALFKKMVKDANLDQQIHVDSAGISSEEQGNPPHPGAQAEMAKHGLDYSGMVSRPISPQDFDRSDLIICMDSQNIHYLKQLSPELDKSKIHLCFDIVPGKMGEDIPDPWYDHKFGRTYAQLSESLPKWLDYIKANLL
ncbi:low molecular weight protein-tyrosine-phosphatase [Lentilactobacillus kisonensis]|uniref:protein-tyrosine-phosphatase n=1 Tax=Lentilactobacillus kisonensis DSM 19906 = JCM 15041 TaxID=1423766 RepID=A0A0R1NUG9_9LACO|nr:low molecular weight protein-tyrosine-phosphatase [Lentilactobacillus kisonensis]KRL20283.1 low molecular weight protein-tyrosine-phosphatase PtpA [Lentilactobacillus kisonensis DSM 19906 = JCM 15041]